MITINVTIPAIEKLVDYMASGVVAIVAPMLAPWIAEKNAKAGIIMAMGRKEEQILEAKGKVKSTELIAKVQEESLLRLINLVPENSAVTGNQDEIVEKIMLQVNKQLRNISNIGKMAENILEGKNVKDHDIDHEWITRFYTDAQNVSSEHVQMLWAKILSGEVENPGGTSLHTLSILKNMNQSDAVIFENFCRFTFDSYIVCDDKNPQTNIIFPPTSTIPDFPSRETLATLSSYGLVDLSLDPELEIRIPLEKPGYFSCGKTSLRVSQYDLTKVNNKVSYGYSGFYVSCHQMTPQGIELCAIVEATMDKNFLRQFARFFYRKNSKQILYVVEQAIKTGGKLEPWMFVIP